MHRIASHVREMYQKVKKSFDNFFLQYAKQYCNLGYFMLFYILNYCVFTTSYNKLWKLLVDKKMSKAELRKASGVSPNTMTKLRRDEPVMLSVLDKICKTLGVNYGDIVDYIADENDESKMSNINTI